MSFPISSWLGDYSSSGLPNDTGFQAGGAGRAGGAVRGSGMLWTAPQAAGTPPALTAADIVVAKATIPAGAFDAAGRELMIEAFGSFAANANTKTIKMIVAPTTSTVGIAVVGGTTIATSGALTTNNLGWRMKSSITKVGAAGANTQIASQLVGQAGAVGLSLAAPQALALVESDCLLWGFSGKWFN